MEHLNNLAAKRKDIITFGKNYTFFFHEHSILAEVGLNKADIETLTDVCQRPPTLVEALNFVVTKSKKQKVGEIRQHIKRLGFYASIFHVKIDLTENVAWADDLKKVPNFRKTAV